GTNRPGARTGEFLVRRHILTREEATRLLLEAKRHNELFHAYLVDRGVATRLSLQDLLYERTEEMLHAVLHTEDGRFVLDPVPPRQFDRHAPVVDPELVSRLLLYRNLWPQAYERLWANRAVLRWVPGIETNPMFHKLDEEERQVLDLVNGRRP